MRRRSKATSSGCGGSRRRRRSSSAGSEVPLPISSRSPALKTPPLVASGADARWAGRRRARALGRRGGRHRPLPVHRAPPVPELLLGRRRCVPIAMVRSRPAPYHHMSRAISPECVTSRAVRSCVIAVPAATTPPSARTSSPCSTRTAAPPASVCIRSAKRAHTSQCVGVMIRLIGLEFVVDTQMCS